MNGLTQSRPILLRQHGTAAVEMALLSFVMAGVLMAPIMIAHSLMQVTVAQRASYNAVHMLAVYPTYQRLDPSSNPIDEANATLIDQIAAAGLAPVSSDAFTISCTGSANCRATAAPAEIQINLSMDVLNLGDVAPDFSTVNLTFVAWDRYAN